MEHHKITRLTLAGLFAAMAFVAFSYLRIEIPMGLGLTGKIYVGHTFLILAGLLLGSTYGGLSGAVGLTLADILAGYTTSAPPTFLAKFLLGFSAGFIAWRILDLSAETPLSRKLRIAAVAGTGACLVNVVTEPLIRYSFKYYVLGYPYQVAWVSAINCAVSMAVSAIPSVVLAVILYRVLLSVIPLSGLFPRR